MALLRKIGVNDNEGRQVMMCIDKFDKVGLDGLKKD